MLFSVWNKQLRVSSTTRPRHVALCCIVLQLHVLIPLTERSKARVCGRSIAGIAGLNPVEGMDVCLLCVRCRVEALATGWSLVQRSRIDCGASRNLKKEATLDGVRLLCQGKGGICFGTQLFLQPQRRLHREHVLSQL
jgi:hypothetical protein